VDLNGQQVQLAATPTRTLAITIPHDPPPTESQLRPLDSKRNWCATIYVMGPGRLSANGTDQMGTRICCDVGPLGNRPTGYFELQNIEIRKQVRMNRDCKSHSQLHAPVGFVALRNFELF
jgi:hypothetical protein